MKHCLSLSLWYSNHTYDTICTRTVHEYPCVLGWWSICHQYGRNVIRKSIEGFGYINNGAPEFMPDTIASPWSRRAGLLSPQQHCGRSEVFVVEELEGIATPLHCNHLDLPKLSRPCSGISWPSRWSRTAFGGARSDRQNIPRTS